MFKCPSLAFSLGLSDPVPSVGLPVPVPQAIADPEPADLDRVQRGFVPVVLSAAIRALEPHFVSGPHSLLQLLCPF